MASWVTIGCPACASTIKVPRDRVILACSRCGTELVVRQAGDVISLAPLAEALRRVEDDPAEAHQWSRSQAQAEILELLSEIDQLWLERRRDLTTSLRLIAAACFSCFIAVTVDIGWLRCLAALVALIGLPGLYGLYDYFIGKSKAARRQRLEQALIAIWPVLEQSAENDQPKPAYAPPPAPSRDDTVAGHRT